jgi:hypothetical protein
MVTIHQINYISLGKRTKETFEKISYSKKVDAF